MVIGTLGPKGTYSDMASQRYLLNKEGDINYYTTIQQVFNALAIGDVTHIVVPIENTLAGFVLPVLDGLSHHSFTIVEELLLPIHFACIGNGTSYEAITKLFVQPVALGQCEQFVTSLGCEIIQTASNIDSLEKFKESSMEYGAIIPYHTLKTLTKSPSFVIEDVTDFSHNETRFIVVCSQEELPTQKMSAIKTSLIIRDDQDHAGILHDISRALAKRSINMLAILSRPTREAMGKYYFYIEIEGDITTLNTRDALKEIEQKYRVQLLGSYGTIV